jgi:hypothetical protein
MHIELGGDNRARFLNGVCDATGKATANEFRPPSRGSQFDSCRARFPLMFLSKTPTS